MPKQTKICRTCGKPYVVCHTTKATDGIFHWREVACSPKCGMEYLSKISQSRQASVDEEESVTLTEEPVCETTADTFVESTDNLDAEEKEEDLNAETIPENLITEEE
jgi:hypothetical protein